jgi:phenylalanyl-tRNA synthetase beta chain
VLVSFKWLKELVALDMSPEALAEAVTRAGIPVESVEYLNKGVEGVSVGLLTQIERHPNADKLSVVQVDVGGERPLNVVTAAPGIAVGQKVPVARVGAKLPSESHPSIVLTDFRGVPSEGMLCSAEELGLDLDKLMPHEKEGIYPLPADAVPGEDIVRTLGLDDVVLDLELTPNRSDCMGMWNVAREVAAVTGGRLSLPRVTESAPGGECGDQAWVRVDAVDLCPRFSARLVENVAAAPSPAWLKQRLMAMGVRSINNIVDVSNLVMLETNQPLHFYDYDTLAGHGIVARRAAEGERFVTLDGQTRDLTGDTLVIADGEKAVGLAGVMGGLNTEITDQTTKILIEAAWFQPVSIRRTSQAFGLRSEAAQRFEKGIDITQTKLAADRAAQMLAAVGAGREVTGALDVRGEIEAPPEIRLRLDKINHDLGTHMEASVVRQFLDALQITVLKERGGDAAGGSGAAGGNGGNGGNSGNSARDGSPGAPGGAVDGAGGNSARGGQPGGGTEWLVQPPSWRRDIALEADLVEEAARLYGYDQIDATLPVGGGRQSGPARTPSQKLRRDLAHFMVGQGFLEIVPYSFIHPGHLDRLRVPEGHPWREAVALMNPQSEEQGIMRTTMLPSLLSCAAGNLNRQNRDLRLFEVGKIYRKSPAPGGHPLEIWSLGAVCAGGRPKSWIESGPKYDFYYLKGVLEALFQKISVRNVRFTPDQSIPGLHPGRCARIEAEGRVLGFVGEIHPKTAGEYEMDQRAVVFYLDAEALSAEAKAKTYQPVPRYPALTRDLAVTVPAELSGQEVTDAMIRLGGELLQDVRLFDVYQGEQIAEGNKSLAFSLSWRSPEKTLTDQEVNALQERIESGLEDLFKGRIRGR